MDHHQQQQQQQQQQQHPGMMDPMYQQPSASVYGQQQPTYSAPPLRQIPGVVQLPIPPRPEEVYSNFSPASSTQPGYYPSLPPLERHNQQQLHSSYFPPLGSSDIQLPVRMPLITPPLDVAPHHHSQRHYSFEQELADTRRGMVRHTQRCPERLYAPHDNANQLPSEADFYDLLNDYIVSLSPKKRDKALIPLARYDNIMRVLQDPKCTTIESAQFRFWSKKMFSLASIHNRPVVTHEGKPVAVKEDLYIVLTTAHLTAQHGGRDKTSAQVRRHFSWVPKELIARFVKACPQCKLRRSNPSSRQLRRKSLSPHARRSKSPPMSPPLSSRGPTYIYHHSPPSTECDHRNAESQIPHYYEQQDDGCLSNSSSPSPPSMEPHTPPAFANYPVDLRHGGDLPYGAIPCHDSTQVPQSQIYSYALHDSHYGQYVKQERLI